MNAAPFFVVWREGGGPPTVKHTEESLARMEAERLAREHPGADFHVLRCVGTAYRRDVAWIQRDIERGDPTW